MEAIRQWAFSICCAMVACGLAQLLLPKSNMEKMFRICVSIFFLCCLLSPVFLQTPGLRLDIQEISQQEIEERALRLTSLLERQANQAAGEDIKKIVAQNLQEKGIKYTSITIDISTNGQHGGEDISVDITLDREYEPRHEEIRGRLKSELGVEVRLGYA